MTVAPAERQNNIPPYAFATIARRVRELRAQGHDVIRIDMGSPDMPPAPEVVQALHTSALDDSHHGYAGFAGIPELRQAFADYYARRFEVGLNAETEVLPLIGSKEGIVNLQLALVDPGDVVLVSDPGYPAYDKGTVLAGGEPYAVPLLAENGFLPVLEDVPAEIVDRAKLMWINYPNNPTGAVASLGDLQRIVDFCREHDIMLAHDNPYADLTFDG
ncbi:MAG: aminotransferase class I/II-fold pyridoxal phosphate-dependent enzyme, partial [Anaerolineae bacterium]